MNNNKNKNISNCSLQLCSLTHRFKKQEVLHDVSLNVEKGDCYGLLGHNGAGKTTLLRIALGLIKPNGGAVAVDGFNLRAYPREAGVLLRGLIEVPSFNENWSGLKNLKVLARLQGFNHKLTAIEANRVFELVGLNQHNGAVNNKRVRNYSQGMKQRLGIAQTLIGKPSYILLDEPLNGLDPQAIMDMRCLIRRLTKDENIAVVISSHQLNEISGLCNKVAILREGALLVEKSMESLLETDKKLYRLSVAAEPSLVDEFLTTLSVDPQQEHGANKPRESTFLINLNEMKPAQLASHLLEKNIELVALTPCDPSLEEVYLKIDEKAARESIASAPHTNKALIPSFSSPKEKRAPKWAFLRGMNYEMTRFFSGFKSIIFLTLPAIIAWVSIFMMYQKASSNAEKVGKEVFSITQITAFDGVGAGLKIGLPILMVLMVGLASQSIAGEQTSGTLRYLFLRPISRIQISLSKLSMLILICMMGYALLVITTLGASAYFFDFIDLGEVLPNGKIFPLVKKEEMLRYLWPVLYTPILPLVSYTALGFAIGSWLKNSVGALVAALSVVFILDLGRVVFPFQEKLGWLLSSHMPSPFGGDSFVLFYSNVVQGVSNATNPFAGQCITISLVWLVFAMGFSIITLKRKAG